MPGPRPQTCGKGPPPGRACNRPAASPGTRLWGWWGIFIGVPVSLLRPVLRNGTSLPRLSLGTPHPRPNLRPPLARLSLWTPLARLGLEQHAQARAGALGNLAVLLEGPPEARAELRAIHSKRDLGDQNETLVEGEAGRDESHPAQLQAVDDERQDLGAGIGGLDSPLIRPTQREGALQGRLQRTAAVHRATAVQHAGAEALLERVGKVQATGEPLPAASAHEQLEHGLAQAVLEILAPQPVAVRAQQGLTAGTGHERDELGGVPRNGVPRGGHPRGRIPLDAVSLDGALRSGLPPQPRRRPAPGERGGRVALSSVHMDARGGQGVGGSDRHIGMSQPAAGRPPSQ
jgi:hypothetical protein